jgi:hypothetical protein
MRVNYEVPEFIFKTFSKHLRRGIYLVLVSN